MMLVERDFDKEYDFCWSSIFKWNEQSKICENYKFIVQISNVRLWHFTAKNIILTRFISLLIYWSPQLWGHVHIFTYFGQKPWFFCYVENTIFTKSLFWTWDSVRAGPIKLAVFLENGSKDFLIFCMKVSIRARNSH